MSLEDYRKEFPAAERRVFYNNAGVAPICGPAARAAEAFAAEACAEGIWDSRRWAARLEEARRTAAELLGAKSPREVAFVSSTSHGLSHVAAGLDWREGDNVVLPAVEFPSNVYPWLALSRLGVEARRVPRRGLRIEIDDLRAAIGPRTRLLTVSSIQYATGQRLDLAALGQLCREEGVLFCVDAIQSLGAFPLDVEGLGIDFLSADGHKWLLAFEGLGLFYCRAERTESLKPRSLGWHSVADPLAFDKIDFTLQGDAGRFEEGSHNLIGVLALEAAIKMLLEAGLENVSRRALGLAAALEEELIRRGFEILSPREREADRSATLVFRGKEDPRATFRRLVERDVVCALRGGGVRLSPHFYNNDEDARRFFEALEG